jgi:hypothetical protein
MPKKKQTKRQRKQLIEQIHDEEPRFYTALQLLEAGHKDVRHERVPSVTTILRAKDKGFGYHKWLGDQPSFAKALKVRGKRADIGLAVHQMIEQLAKGQSVKPIKGTKMFMKNYHAFDNAYSGFQVMESEKIVYEPKLGYAGTLDRICWSREHILIDWKTSKHAYKKDWLLQLAAYWHATGRIAKEAWVVKIEKSSKFRERQIIRFTRRDLITGFRIFKHVFEVWKYDRNYAPQYLSANK